MTETLNSKMDVQDIRRQLHELQNPGDKYVGLKLSQLARSETLTLTRADDKTHSVAVAAGVGGSTIRGLIAHSEHNLASGNKIEIYSDEYLIVAIPPTPALTEGRLPYVLFAALMSQVVMHGEWMRGQDRESEWLDKARVQGEGTLAKSRKIVAEWRAAREVKS